METEYIARLNIALLGGTTCSGPDDNSVLKMRTASTGWRSCIFSLKGQEMSMLVQLWSLVVVSCSKRLQNGVWFGPIMVGNSAQQLQSASSKPWSV